VLTTTGMLYNSLLHNSLLHNSLLHNSLLHNSLLYNSLLYNSMLCASRGNDSSCAGRLFFNCLPIIAMGDGTARIMHRLCACFLCAVFHAGEIRLRNIYSRKHHRGLLSCKPTLLEPVHDLRPQPQPFGLRRNAV
jgi:hypothetical protein